jgi:hypothetical protein
MPQALRHCTGRETRLARDHERPENPQPHGLRKRRESFDDFLFIHTSMIVES